jgi:hypothetical protein
MILRVASFRLAQAMESGWRAVIEGINRVEEVVNGLSFLDQVIIPPLHSCHYSKT